MMRTQLVSSTVEKYQIEPANPPAGVMISMQTHHLGAPDGAPIIILKPIPKAKISAGAEQRGRE